MVEVTAGSGDTAEKYYLEIRDLKIAGSGVGVALRPTMRAIVDTKQNLNDVVSYQLKFREAVNSGKLRITGVGIFNKIKIAAVMKSLKFFEK